MLDSDWLKQQALDLGFHACGIAPAGALPDYGRQLAEWLADGCQGDMQYMQQHQDKRTDPRLLVPGAKSVISVLLSYAPDKLMQGACRVARFAYGTDYHIVIKDMLWRLIQQVKQRYPDFEGRPFVDTAPISDKLWARQAGLGWIGRNTLLINPELGSWVNIGEVVTTAEADHYDSPIDNQCGSCTLCQQACPNEALQKCEDHTRLCAPRCAAYHTIENRREQIADTVKLSHYIFGCDICQQACPYNQGILPHRQIAGEQLQRLQALPAMDEAQFGAARKGTSLDRVSYAQLQRNFAKIQQETTE